MRFDASIGAAVPSLGADEIIAAARGIEHVATLRVDAVSYTHLTLPTNREV